MTKHDLIEKMADEVGISKKKANDAINVFLDSTKNSLKNGEKVTLVGFGTFKVVKRAARKGVNPATGAKINISARNVAKFKAGKKLKEAVR
ncbi:MAG: HU family DNA-binding protein [Candidatus Cloacimonetes bacterium]|nr:HU family DNA-binding protein [Candidatus Cloacimonadota bacterium]MBL7108412.1 HU family DNA-binding protein [Candidatus Cloacimonadota bacterium]